MDGVTETGFVVGSRVTIRERDHPWYGYSGEVVKVHRGGQLIGGGVWAVVCLDAAGHECGVPLGGLADA